MHFRYGLVGRNGVGKTTLLRAIARYEINQFPAHLRVLHVEQEIRGGETSALQCVMAADLEVGRNLCMGSQLAHNAARGGVEAAGFCVEKLNWYFAA